MEKQYNAILRVAFFARNSKSLIPPRNRFLPLLYDSRAANSETFHLE